MRNHHRGSNNANFSRETEPLVSASRAPPVPEPPRPVYNTVTPSGRTVGGGQTDGVFANLSAKPSVGEKLEEFPPVRFPQSSSMYSEILTVADVRASRSRCHPSLLGNDDPDPWNGL